MQSRHNIFELSNGFPTRHGTTVFLADRKSFAKGFLFDMAPLCFNATGNCLRIVSYSTWHHCVSYRQETVRERFPIRLDAIVFLTDRKLFANGFLFDVTPLCFLPAGNCLRIVSYSTWHYCVSCRQETFCEGFPIRHGTTVFLAGRKLFTGRFLDSASDPRNDRGHGSNGIFYDGQLTADSGQSGPTKKRGPMAPLFVIPYFSDV